MRTRQIFGVSTDLASEITSRNYDMIKSGTLRVKVESKPEFKARFGRSPDLADAAFLALDCARQRLGLVAVDPPEKGDKNFKRPPKTIKQLGSALQNSEAVLLD
jgi:dTDP-glucose pyrophosphorylase